jgi:hypothetical protein
MGTTPKRCSSRTYGWHTRRASTVPPRPYDPRGGSPACRTDIGPAGRSGVICRALEGAGRLVACRRLVTTSDESQ